MSTPPCPVPFMACAPVAAFGASHGYRLHGDGVELTASFRLLSPSAHAHAWALQLWSFHESRGALGDLIVSIPLPPLAEIADVEESFTVASSAIVLPRHGEHRFALALTAADARRRFTEIHHLVVYPGRETVPTRVPHAGAPALSRPAATRPTTAQPVAATQLAQPVAREIAASRPASRSSDGGRSDDAGASLLARLRRLLRLG